MAKATVNVKIDADVKERATRVLERMGIDQTTAIDMYFRQIVFECSLPFKPKTEPTLDEKLTKAIWATNPKVTRLNTDGNGNVLIDKEKDPELYDWAVNG